MESFDPSSGKWRREPDLHAARGFHGAAVLDGRLYVLGGLAADGASDLVSVEIYDPGHGVWEPGPALPVPLNRLSATAGADAIYAVGGISMGVGDRASAYVLRSGAESWDSLPPMPTRRHGTAALAWKGDLYVVGGYASGEIFDRLEVFDTEARPWRTQASIAVPRGFAGLQASGERLYLFGGRVRERRVVTEVCSVDSDSWTSGARIPEWRDRFASVAVGGRIYLFGGEASF